MPKNELYLASIRQVIFSPSSGLLTLPAAAGVSQDTRPWLAHVARSGRKGQNCSVTDRPDEQPDELKPSFNATRRHLFPQAVKSGFPKGLMRPTSEELSEACHKFGLSENLYEPVPAWDQGIQITR
jgi:hypothetical protein